MRTKQYFSDDELLLHIAAGDERAFRQFYDRHWNRVYTMALMYLKNVLSAQDIVQEVFEKLWKKRSALHDVENAEAYLFVLGRNHILSVLRKKSVTLIDISEISTGKTDILQQPDKLLDAKQVAMTIRDAVEQLPPQQKKVFQLSKEQGFSLKEVAEIMGVSYSTAREYMSLALSALRKYLSQHLEELPVVISLFFLPC